MDDVERLKQDVREGRIPADRLVELVVRLQRELQEARRRIEELQKTLGGSATVKFAEPFSLRAEERRQEARGKKPRKRNRPRRRGRITTADKIARAQRTERVFPAGIAESQCKLSHTRPVWRLEQGRAVLVAYEIYRGPGNQYGKIPGVLGRGEFGIEIIVAIAYQVYIVGLSFDKVCLLLNFFQNLRLRKSQADALLNQLSRHWESEFDGLCTLLANSAVVHTDETSWSLNSVWAFLSEKVRVLFFGVHKDAQTLQAILDPATFALDRGQRRRGGVREFHAVAKVLGPSAAEGDQADAAGTRQRRVPQVRRSTAGYLPCGVPCATRRAARRRGPGAESRRTG